MYSLTTYTAFQSHADIDLKCEVPSITKKTLKNPTITMRINDQSLWSTVTNILSNFGQTKITLET